MELFPKPKVNVGLPAFVPVDPDPPQANVVLKQAAPDVLKDGLYWLVGQLAENADELEAAAKKMDEDGAPYVEDKLVKQMRLNAGAEAFRASSWMIRVAMVGRLREIAEGTLKYPEPPEVEDE